MLENAPERRLGLPFVLVCVLSLKSYEVFLNVVTGTPFSEENSMLE